MENKRDEQPDTDRASGNPDPSRNLPRRFMVLAMNAGGWRPDTLAGNVSFTREPEDATDLMTWVRHVLNSDAYGLNGAYPDALDSSFAEAINDTWELLRLVADKRGRDDAPLRPEPDGGVLDAFDNVESAYSLAFTRGQLKRLLDYLEAKLTPVSNVAGAK